MKTIKGMLRGLEIAMAASAFAEEGEFDTARKMMLDSKNAKARREDAGDSHTSEGRDLRSPAYGK